MIIEVVKWDVKPNQENEFEAEFERAQKILSKSLGYISHQFQKCIEKPNRYILIVEWEKLEDHTVGFQKSNVYQEYRSMLVQYLEPGTTMEHYEILHKSSL